MGFIAYTDVQLPIASGVKNCQPRFVLFGRSQAMATTLAIGGNHFIHAIRRNIDINIILFLIRTMILEGKKARFSYFLKKDW